MANTLAELRRMRLGRTETISQCPTSRLFHFQYLSSLLRPMLLAGIEPAASWTEITDRWIAERWRFLNIALSDPITNRTFDRRDADLPPVETRSNHVRSAPEPFEPRQVPWTQAKRRGGGVIVSNSGWLISDSTGSNHSEASGCSFQIAQGVGGKATVTELIDINPKGPLQFCCQIPPNQPTFVVSIGVAGSRVWTAILEQHEGIETGIVR